MKHIIPTVLVGLILLVWTGPALAQGYSGQVPSGPPAVSPWLNLNRPGTSTGINYYGLVRPQFQTYGGLQSLQQEVNANQAAIATGIGTGQNLAPTTGVAAGFMTQGRFFMTRGGRGASGLGTQKTSAPISPSLSTGR